MGRTAERVAWAAVTLALVGGCGLPSDSYEWNPALQKSEGKLDGLVKDLPLGTLNLLEHHHPKDPDKDTITLSNVDGLVPFVHKQDAPIAYAAAYYGQLGVSGVAYAALLPVGRSPATGKENLYVGKAGSLMEVGTPLTFRVRPVEGLLPPGGPCTLYRVAGDAGLAGNIDYVALVGSAKNLYLELIVQGTVKGARDESISEQFGELPFKAVNDWTQESLKTLVAAHERTGLGVCSLPK